MKYRTVSGQSLDEIVWQHYGNIPGAVEVVLAANRGLADHGAILPSGLLIDLPNYQPPKPSRGIRLWD